MANNFAEALQAHLDHDLRPRDGFAGYVNGEVGRDVSSMAALGAALGTIASSVESGNLARESARADVHVMAMDMDPPLGSGPEGHEGHGAFWVAADASIDYQISLRGSR
jgi:hypothetical protein